MAKKKSIKITASSSEDQLAKIVRLLVKIEEHLDYIADVIGEEAEGDEEEQESAPQQATLAEQVTPMLLGVLQGMSQGLGRNPQPHPLDPSSVSQYPAAPPTQPDTQQPIPDLNDNPF
jgi:hypothetical protein